MRTTLSKSSPTPTRGIVCRGQLALAGILLIGVIVMGYGYFRQNKVGLYVGLVVIAAGILSGVVQILLRGNR